MTSERIVRVLCLVGVIVATGGVAAAAGEPNDDVGRAWATQALKKIPIAYRHDGFSIFFHKPPLTPRMLEETYVDPQQGTNASILVWGLGPGSVFCYGTKVGEIFGEGLTEAQRKMVREGDLWVHENVTGLINSGNDPLRVAVKRSHELGIKLIARLEMNHEYGPASDDNWKWVAFVGSLNKEHPEYRIGGRSVLLDFKHREVRDFKLAIFREALEAGADGIAMDFAVYPPFFADPEAGLPVMTEFVREARALLDEFSSENGRRELMVRVPAENGKELGLDWAAWMQEGLVDYVVPTHYRANATFDIRVDDFVAMGRKTGVKMFPTIWQALGFVDTDPRPDGTRRYDKPKTEGMFNAQALLFHRAGVDGLQLGFSQDQWRKRPYLNGLAEPEKLEVADKHYMVDVRPHCPVRFPASGEKAPFVVEKTVPLRVADDMEKAKDGGHGVTTTVVLYAKPLKKDERLEIFINGFGPHVSMGKGDDLDEDGNPLDLKKLRGKTSEREWWRRGELRFGVNPAWWKLGGNSIRFRYTTPVPDKDLPFYITWVDVLIDYTVAGEVKE